MILSIRSDNRRYSRLDSLAALGIDAIWLSPYMKSPQKDAGYDVSDYTQTDREYGTNADFKRLIAEAQRAETQDWSSADGSRQHGSRQDDS